MSFVQILDHALWVEHIHGNKTLQARISEMQEGELIELKVNGVRGMWQRITDRSPAAMPGVKAMGEAESMWHQLRSERQGGITTVEICN